jgi:hypothetical protein
MFNVITTTPAFLPDMSRSFMQNFHKEYMWTTPYATLEEAEEAKGYIERCGNHKATTTIEEV